MPTKGKSMIITLPVPAGRKAESTPHKGRKADYPCREFRPEILGSDRRLSQRVGTDRGGLAQLVEEQDTTVRQCSRMSLDRSSY